VAGWHPEAYVTFNGALSVYAYLDKTNACIGAAVFRAEEL
jgi:hypothetical protein